MIHVGNPSTGAVDTAGSQELIEQPTWFTLPGDLQAKLESRSHETRLMAPEEKQCGCPLVSTHLYTHEHT